MIKWLQRYFFFILGLIINSFGISLITKSALGTSPISSVPYVFSLFFTKISFGLFTFILNMIFIIIQIIILKKDFHPIQFLQILANIIFSFFIDITMGLLSGLILDSIMLKLISLLIGCTILALGICIEVSPNVIVVPGEGIVRAISTAYNKNFGKIKIYFDVTLILISFCASLLFFHSLQGIGIGTVISAVLVGRIVTLINRYFPLIKYIENLAK